MSGPQFAHIQTWSRKPNKAGQSIDHVRIGSALGLDLIGKDLMRDLASIEEDLVAAENPAPEADRNDGPEV